MTDLPAGWAWADLAEVADIQGGIQKQAKRRPVLNKYPFLRVANVHRGKLDLADVHEVELFDGELERFELRRGDLLVVEGNGSPDQIGRAATWDGSIDNCVHQNHLIRVRPTVVLLHDFLELVWNSPLVARHLREVAGSTSGLYTLSTGKLKSVRLPLPPLAEQRRIVAALDGHLSRLEVAAALARTASRRLRQLKKRVLIESVPMQGRDGWLSCSVGEAGSVDLGRQRHPDWHRGPNMRPYLRVANVFEDRIDTTDVMEMDFPPPVFEKFQLRDGDILLNEGQSPELLGRPAMYRGTPAEVAFTNSLLRFRVGEGIDPEWALLVFRRHMHAGRFSQEVRITTNIAHLSAGRFKAIEFPVPPLVEQRSMVDQAKVALAGVDRLAAAVDQAERHASALRASLLLEAFSGRLVPQDPTDEPAFELLARIRAGRVAAPPKQSRRSRRSQKELAAPPTRVIGDVYEQGALPL
ncbi:restriction endonuclease subunit S [Micromonospora sp. NPDC005237]|uniref:restriction endonuclease subunit S n=1 Tax=Micromonospora sp. NPDC005237 TaxID=3155113 RepID=UPI0033A274FE